VDRQQNYFYAQSKNEADLNAPERLIHEGLDDWIFLTGGSNYVTTLYDRDGGNLPDVALRSWKTLLEQRAARCSACGIRYVHAIVPDKLTVYGHKQGTPPLVDPDLSPAMRLAEMMRNSPASHALVDLVSPMRAGRDETALYWKSDTHWTPEGCVLAYQTLCQHLGLAAGEKPFAAPHREFGALLDLGQKLTPQRWETFSEYAFAGDARRIYANHVAAILENPVFGAEIHRGSRVIYENAKARNPVKILLFGDSFASQRDNFLTGLLAETAQSVEFVWSSSVDWRYVKRRRPDILITEIAERFMSVIPKDRAVLPAIECGQILKARRRQFEAWLRKRR
jgi:alginate O-acetyltransferase complex protein AlgJ